MADQKIVVNFRGQKTFTPVLDWISSGSVYLEDTTDGADSWNKLTDYTKLGIAGMCGLLPAIGFTDFSLTSGYRSFVPEGGSTTSYHLQGMAVDFWEGSTGNTWMGKPDDLVDLFENYWGEVIFHDVGSGYHLHVGNYLGNLCNEDPETLKKIQEAAASGGYEGRTQSGRQGTSPGGGLFGGGNTPMEHAFRVQCLGKDNYITYLQPEGKTFCEPVYPDLIYLSGSIPSSVVGNAHEAMSSGADKGQNSIYTQVPANITPTQSTAGAAGISGNLERAIQWATAIANDQSHGYSQGAGIGSYTGSREGPDYDCASFVYHALDAGGFPVLHGGAGDCESLWGDLQAAGGWVKYAWNIASSNLKRGDILCNPDRHVAMYIGNGQTVEAAGVNSGDGDYVTGDQGNEIDFYDADGRDWTEVYRFMG